MKREPLWGVARTVGRRVRSFFDAPLDENAAPLELLQAALDDLEKKVQPAGRGSRVFPYTRVAVTVTQPAADTAAIEAVFALLDARLRERLAEVRCEPPAALDINLSVRPDSGGPVLRVECSNGGNPVRSRPARGVPELQLRIVKGRADRVEYSFPGGVVSLGRGAEPADAFGRVRRNDVAFGDERDGVTETVARAHGRIEFDAAAGAYLLFNESSTNPTFLLRGGRSLRVAPRDRRGVRLASGDALQFGRAIIEVVIGNEG
jgi:FHA domain